MMKKSYKKIVSMILAAVMVLGVPCGVYADTLKQTIAVSEGSITTSTTGVKKSTTSYSNGKWTGISGANNYCHVSMWLTKKSGTVVSQTSIFTAPSESLTVIYKSGYGIKGATYYANGSVQTGSATTYTAFTYSVTP